MTKATVRGIDSWPASSTVTLISNQSALSPLLAETAHDLNNALSAIRLHLDLLAHDLSTPGSLANDSHSTGKARQRLRQLQPAVQHAAEIARQLMNPATLDAANAHPGRTLLNPVLQSMVPILSAMLPPRVELRLRLAPNLNPVAIDPVHVIRIVSNLVLNSCAALRRSADPAGGTITVETAHAPDNSRILLRVRDTGSGMSAATRLNLFRPFFTTKPRRENAGLGLASVLRMVRRAGGTIQVESTPGHGTDVAIAFPALDTKKSPQPSRPPQSRAAIASYLKINPGPKLFNPKRGKTCP
jgi:signal transduction histidine kinase